MRKFNYLEAIEYLKQNYNADIFLEELPHVKLKVEVSGVDYKVLIKNAQLGNEISNWSSMILANWILNETVKPQRTHKEIMTNWFHHHKIWRKVDIYKLNFDNNYYFDNGWRSKEFFNDLTMSDIPMEE
jgi:hypothetical protein